MDILITILMWIGGFFAFAVLGLAFAFSAGASAQTGKSEFSIISGGSAFLIIYLLWMAISSVLSSASGTIVEETKSATNISLWIFYALFFFTFFGWLFVPSKDEKSQKGSIIKKIIGSMLLTRDESNLQAWDPNWKPKEKEKE